MEDVKFDEEKIINTNEISKCSEVAVLKDDEVESTKSEMMGVREENMRLKTLLQQIEKDYKNLKTRFIEVFQHESNKNSSQNMIPTTINNSAENISTTAGDDQEQELVSLRLGTISTPKVKEDITQYVITSSTTTSNSSKITSCENDGELKLGLEYNTEGLKNTGKNPGLENYGEKWPPSKVLKTERSGGDEDVSQTSVKRARVCVRARCDTPTMNDGCQWRKYGQKIAKGNPCPRAYYRCTVSPSCPVRKQVQRCMEDMSILITTYEGTHNHPLPISATAMASTTSAAASMLLSGSSTSQPSAATPPTSSLHGPIFPPFDTSRPQPYYIPNTSSPFPTITLDLTTNSTTTHGGFSLFSSGSRSTPKSLATNFSFSSVESNMVPTVWGSGGFSKYGTSNYSSDYQFLKPAQEQKMCQPYLEKFNQGSSQQALTETLTKVITSDPSFRSVIAAAISTMAGNASGTGKLDNDKRDLD